MTKEEAIKVINGLRIPCAVTIHGNSCDRNEALDMAIEALSADAVEVVRCKDCRHLYNKDFCSFFGSPTDTMDYCSHREKREQKAL